MNGKFGKLLIWSTGAFQIVMKNKLVSIGCFLVQGLFHVFSPVGSLRWDAKMLAGLLALYSLISIVFVLTNNNQTVGKGKTLAGGLVKGVFDGNKDTALQGQKLLSKNRTIDEKAKKSKRQWDNRLQVLSDKQKNEPKAEKAVLIFFYCILLIGSVLLFFWSDVTVYAIHIIIGALMIADGISGISAYRTVVSRQIPLKNQKLSLFVSIFTVLVGALFIVMAWNTAVFTMQLMGLILIIKSVVELIILIRNREVLSSVTDTLQQIKQQGDDTNEKKQSEVSTEKH